MVTELTLLLRLKLLLNSPLNFYAANGFWLRQKAAPAA
jgi:hypothetical protein